MDRVIIFVDIVKSTETKVKLGDAAANQMIAQRLQDIEADFRLRVSPVRRRSRAWIE